MLYVFLALLAVLVLVNVYASRFVLRSTISDASQKRRQLAFVWLLPALGALITLHVLKPSRSFKSGGGLVGMEYDQAWDHVAHDKDCPPDIDCGE